MQSSKDSPLFTADEIGELRATFNSWFQSAFGITSVDWSVRLGQPYCLHALQCLSECLGIKKQPCGIVCFRESQRATTEISRRATFFFRHFPTKTVQSLRSASVTGRERRTPQRFFSLCFRKEIDKGYLEKIASLAHAQQCWGDRVAVGRMNVVQAPGKALRLIVDSSVCGTNGACYVPESYQLPLLESIRFSSPMRECSSVIGGFSLDIRAAHKTSESVSVTEVFRALGFTTRILIVFSSTKSALLGLLSAPTVFNVFQASWSDFSTF